MIKKFKNLYGSLKVYSIESEKKKELHVREVEDKQRIMELQIHIKQQKKDIENDLEHLHTLEKKHNEILNYGKESQLEVDIGAIDSNSPNKHGTFADLNQETSVKGTQERLTTKGGSGKSKQPTKNKIGSRNNLSPSKQSQANLTKLTSKTSLSAQSPPKRPTTAAKVTLKPANKQAKTKP